MKKIISGIVVTLLLVGMLTLAFKIPPVKASGTIYIRADGSVEGTTSIQTADNVTYVFVANINASLVVGRNNIIIDGNGYTLQGTWEYHSKGVDLSGRTNVTVQNATIKAFGYGIWLNYSSNNTVSGNNITANNWGGILLDSSSNNTVSGNNITANNGDGISLYSSSNNTLSGNIVTANSMGIGISLYSSSNNTLSGNIVTANSVGGMYLFSSSNNTLSGNIVTANGYGIFLVTSSNNNLSGNNVTANNGVGIGLIANSSNNSVFHNDFVNNAGQVYTERSNNAWDDGYPSGGNYWSDYSGVDLKNGPGQNQTGGDGKGDAPYIIDANNRDRYPLMTPTPVIPEFPSTIILTLLMTLTTLAVALTKKRLLRHRCKGAFIQRLKSAYLKL